MVANYGVDSLSVFSDLANLAVLQGAGLTDPSVVQPEVLVGLLQL